jgi:hypothetical protein
MSSLPEGDLEHHILPYARPSVSPDFIILEVVEGLLERLVKDGWHHGAPDHIRPESRRIDRRVCGLLHCGHCHHKGLEYWPLHKGGRYKVVAMCDHCGTEEEL